MPALSAAEARARFEQAPVARLATVSAAGEPHLVPIVFALVRSTIVTAVDHKPKSTPRLKRLRNIAETGRVAVLVDEYADDWAQLWWARADGLARVVDHAAEELDAALTARYRQYADHRPGGPFILIEVERWSGWTAR